MIPQDIPTSVSQAISAVMGARKMTSDIEAISQAAVAYNKAWNIVQMPACLSVHEATIEKAQRIAASNGWDWDGIVSAAIEKHGIIYDERGIEVLRARQAIFDKADQRFNKFSAKFDLEVQAKAQKDAAIKAELELAANAEKELEQQKVKQRSDLAKQKVLAHLFDVLSKFEGLETLDLGNAKVKKNFQDELKIHSKVKNETLLSFAIDQYFKGKELQA